MEGKKIKMVSKTDYDCCGWATKANIKCSDGRTIMPDAFKDNDGQIVPLVWNHVHGSVDNVLGHALLENRKDGVYAYCKFNDTESGKNAKMIVEHGDITAFSIFANNLKERMKNVMHGVIREVSLVLAGANSGARIQPILIHGEELIYLDENEEDELVLSHGDALIYTGENLELYHADESEKKEDEKETEVADENKEKTIADIIETMNDDQKEALNAIVGMALNEKEDGGDDIEMKHNVFENDSEMNQGAVLSHSDEMEIVKMAKQPGVGSLQQALAMYCEENDSLAHSIFDDAGTETLFPEYELLKKGEPYTLERDQTWIDYVISKIHKSPYSRIRTRFADARIAELKAKGYQKKGNYKSEMGKIKLLGRSIDPQTVYIKSDMHRDDIVDTTDFDVVGYQWNMMRHVLNETLALAALVGDGREEGDADKIHEDHIKSIWHDDDLYCIHQDVDIAAAKKELQGTNTNANFGENYIYAEAIITAALYSREQYKGSGSVDLFCTPHLLNVMLLARDLNGRRIYDSKADLAAALNVNDIHTVEQFEGLTRLDTSGKEKKLLGLFVNLSDYQFGSTKGGEVTRFEDFDIDFNKYKYLLETRLSGALTLPYSAIALEEPVVAA